MQADALEQIGYQAESGPWRKFCLTGAKELREGIKKLPVPGPASPDAVRAMTLDTLFDYFAVRLTREKAEGKLAKEPSASVSLSRNTLNDLMLKQTTLKDAFAKGDVKITGDPSKLNYVFDSQDDYSLVAANR